MEKSIKREKIDLKELEKFGFKDERHRYTYEAYQIIHFYRQGKKRKRKKFTQRDTISICKETREIRFNYDYCIGKHKVFYMSMLSTATYGIYK